MLAESSIDVPRLLERVENFIKYQSNTCDVYKAHSLLEKALARESKVSSWLGLSRRPPYRVHHLKTDCNESMDFRPSRLLYYDNPTQVAVHNAWRLLRIRLLDIAVRLCVEIEMSCGEAMHTEQQRAQRMIDDLAEDLCSTIPYYLGWRGSDVNIIGGSMYDLGDIRQPLTDVEVIANWSQLMMIIRSASTTTDIPARHQTWLARYLTATPRQVRAITINKPIPRGCGSSVKKMKILSLSKPVA